MLIIRHKMKYRPPVRSVGVPVLAHSGELIIPVKVTEKLAKWINHGANQLLPSIKQDLKNLIKTVPMLKF